jgi:hypothetical protein
MFNDRETEVKQGMAVAYFAPRWQHEILETL